MITIREYLEWKFGQSQLEALLSRIQRGRIRIEIGTLENNERSIGPQRRSAVARTTSINNSNNQKRPAESFSFDQLRRMMGDIGPRRFLKDLGSRRK
ncbi:hypothetical protein [Brevibacillus borstelensis]|uniref:hypothetical protein n=1 Tax=Brevibacillus borstelensis TaxID=45462 RepID=UPI001143F0A4|nr:hypothetical protein [Brevibacillus borstelensis]MED1881084.1 hypothetical protein [Brevibacillus borstelensis]GED53521.1 hypothetical protein BBO01nite_27620 [Brevibacillus borstelensis]